jgi:hypothetical protein
VPCPWGTYTTQSGKSSASACLLNGTYTGTRLLCVGWLRAPLSGCCVVFTVFFHFFPFLQRRRHRRRRGRRRRTSRLGRCRCHCINPCGPPIPSPPRHSTAP